MNRLFVALDLPKSTRQFLVDLDPHIPGAHWVVAQPMHLTLGFFGEVSPHLDVKLREKLSAIEFGAFFLPLRGIGLFPLKGPPKIIWIGVGSGHPHLFQLYKRVQEAALAVGLQPDLRPWHPHITLARCRDVSAQSVRKFLQSNVDLDAGMIRIEAFHLYCSELKPAGPIHTCQLSIAAKK